MGGRGGKRFLTWLVYLLSMIELPCSWRYCWEVQVRNFRSRKGKEIKKKKEERERRRWSPWMITIITTMEAIITGWGSHSHPTWKWRLLLTLISIIIITTTIIKVRLLQLPLLCQAPSIIWTLTSAVLDSVMELEKMVAFTLPWLLCHSSQMGLYVSWKLSAGHKQKVCST